MAIDTRRKRQNVAQIGCPLPVSVLPGGTIDTFARVQIAWSYGGIPPIPPTPGSGMGTIDLSAAAAFAAGLSADPQTSAELTAAASFIVEISVN